MRTGRPGGTSVTSARLDMLPPLVLMRMLLTGIARLALLACAALGGAAIERSLLEEIGRFTGNMPQTDDITFVAVERVIPGAV